VKEAFYPNYIRFSPDGQKIGLSKYDFSSGNVEYWILPWPDSSKRQPNKIFEKIKFRDTPLFSWMPDSRHIILSSVASIFDYKFLLADTETESISCILTPTAASIITVMFPQMEKRLP